MRNQKFESMTIEVNTPDGVLYYTICEEDGVPSKVISTFGKAGTSLSAWASALDAMINMLLDKKVDINDIISELGSIGGEKTLTNPRSGVKINSGPAGLAIALLEWKRQKYREFHLARLKEEF